MSPDFLIDAGLVFTVAAIRVAEVVLLLQALDMSHERFDIDRVRILDGLNVRKMGADVVAGVLLQKANSIVHLRIVDKGPTDLFEEMMPHNLRQVDSDVGDPVVYEK